MGNLDLENFELGQWLDNKDLGIINFSSDVKGKGFTLQDMSRLKSKQVLMTLRTKVTNTQMLRLTACLSNKLFDGKLAVKDENIDLVFDGKVDLNDTLPEFDSVLNVQLYQPKTA